jgi:HD-GYP domain-containing protein (c-di-GMP phosphodiesterase class II)
MNATPRLGSVLAALSLATDFAMAASAQFGLRSAVLAVALARRLGWDETAQRHVHLQALLRYIGCNVDTQLMAAPVGDELAARRAFAGIDAADKLAVVRLLVARMREAHRDEGRLRTLLATANVLISAEREMAAQFAGHCEVGQRLATRLRLPAEVVGSLGQLYERWDGKGLPNRLRGAEVSPVALIVSLAQDVIVHHDRAGWDAALAMLRQRRGGAHAPAMCDAFIAHAPALYEALVAAEAGEPPQLPGGDAPMDDEALDNACAAMADFADIKSPWTLNHSSAVARLASEAARRLRLSEAEQRLARRAGYLHDIGTVGISAGVWGKGMPLTRAEQEQVRLHAYYTERILAVAPELAALADAAGAVHDRLDGSGYFRRPAAAALPRVARVLAAADMAQALSEDRPHRKALPPDAVARALLDEAAAGRLDEAACCALLDAAGAHTSRRLNPDELTAREVDVLVALARGQSMKQIARTLAIAPKTVDHHLQRIYPKLGVSTRAGATLVAMERGYVAGRG